MAEHWDDDDDDDWDADDDEIDARLGLGGETKKPDAVFDDEEDLAVSERKEMEEGQRAVLKTKGKALAAKRKAAEERKEEEEIARKAMELESEMEEKLTIDERRAMERQREEEADAALTNDLFSAVEATSGSGGGSGAGTAAAAGDTVVMKDLKDHLKHARKVAQCIKDHGKIHLATAFLKEVVQECKPVLDDDAVTEIIKVCNIIKNEKVAAAKRKVKGQAQKSKKDKAAEAKAKLLQKELYGDNNKYDKYDEIGDAYEDDFF